MFPDLGIGLGKRLMPPFQFPFQPLKQEVPYVWTHHVEAPSGSPSSMSPFVCNHPTGYQQAFSTIRLTFMVAPCAGFSSWHAQPAEDVLSPRWLRLVLALVLTTGSTPSRRRRHGGPKPRWAVVVMHSRPVDFQFPSRADDFWA